MKISMVIPTYTKDDHLKEIAIRACLSYRSQIDELIVTEDSGFFVQELYDLADVYILGKENIGFTKNVNRGWKNATGDFVMIVNSDTELMSGNLKDLCIPGCVTSPEIKNQYIPFLAGPFFCVPKEVTKERGYLIEEMRTYASDSEYDNRVRDIFKSVESVKIYHEQQQSVRVAGVDGGEEQNRDGNMYEQLKKEGKAK